jgi:hypothetical protein
MKDCIVGYVVLHDKDGQSSCIHTTDCGYYKRYLESMPSKTTEWSKVFNTIEEAVAGLPVGFRSHNSCLLKARKDSCLLFRER